MRHGSRSLTLGAPWLIVAGVLMLVGTTAVAQEATPPPEPQEAETPAAEPSPQQAPAEPAAPQEAQAPRIYQEAWEIVVEGKAEANGVLELTYQPLGGEAKLLKVNVLAKAKKKEIAADLAKELTFATGSAYKVKVSGNKVKVKLRSKKSPPFNLEIQTQSVNGVSVRIGKG